MAYPDFLTSQPLDVKPELFIDQLVDVCLTPDGVVLLQIRAYAHNPEELPILTHHFHKYPLWQRHKNYLLHPSYFYPESMQSIHFIREEYAGNFQSVFQGLEKNFQVSSTSPSLEQIENYIFASYSDFFMKNAGPQSAYNEYRKLKFSNEPKYVELWKNETIPKNNIDVRVFSRHLKIRALLAITPCLIIAISVYFLSSKIIGLVVIGLSLCLSVIYFSLLLQRNKYQFKAVHQL